MDIGKAIKNLRIRKNISQKDFAAKINISQTYLSLIENNKKMPNFSLINKISEQIGIPIPVLLFLSINDDDVKSSKKEIFEILKPSINQFIEEIFINENDKKTN